MTWRWLFLEHVSYLSCDWDSSCHIRNAEFEIRRNEGSPPMFQKTLSSKSSTPSLHVAVYLSRLMNKNVLIFSHKTWVLLKNTKEIWSHPLLGSWWSGFFYTIRRDENLKEDRCEWLVFCSQNRGILLCNKDNSTKCHSCNRHSRNVMDATQYQSCENKPS